MNKSQQTTPTGSGETVIKIEGLYKSFGKLDVLKGVDFTVVKGENVAVLGKSGSGKSVLIKIMVALLQPDAGTVTILDQNVHALRGKALDALRLRVGFSFQSSALYDSMSIYQNLAFPLSINKPNMTRKEVDITVEETLDAVGLKDKMLQMPADLSGGQRKRIGIARTLILRPEIMLYDEPTAGLDPVTCAEINALINQVQEQYKTSSVIITHDLTCAKNTCNQVAMLIEGSFLKIGTFDAVFQTEDAQIHDFYKYNFIQ